MIERLVDCLEALPDPRDPRKVEHRLVDVLAIAVRAVLGEAESFEDIADYGRCEEGWLRRFLALPNGIPSRATFRRVLMLVDPDAFERRFLDWARAAFRPDEGAPRQVAIDGKTVRRSFDRCKGRSPLHLVSAYATERLRHRARPRPGAAGGRGEGGRADRPPRAAGRPRPRGLPGEPRRARLPARGRRADRGPRRRLPPDLERQPEEGPRRGAGLVRRERVRPRRPAPPLLRRVRRRSRPAGAPAGVRLPARGRLRHPEGLARARRGAGGRDHPRHPRPRHPR